MGKMALLQNRIDVLACAVLQMCHLWAGKKQNVGRQKIKLYRDGWCGRQSVRFGFLLCLCMSTWQYSCRYLFFRLACNGFGLGEEAELTAQKMKVAKMFNTPQQLHSITSAAFLPNRC